MQKPKKKTLSWAVSLFPIEPFTQRRRRYHLGLVPVGWRHRWTPWMAPAPLQCRVNEPLRLFHTKYKLQLTGFRLAPNWLQISFRLEKCNWSCMAPFTPIFESEASLEPVGCNFNLVWTSLKGHFAKWTQTSTLNLYNVWDCRLRQFLDLYYGWRSSRRVEEMSSVYKECFIRRWVGSALHLHVSLRSTLENNHVLKFITQK